MGLAYFNGKGVPVDFFDAAKWTRKAAEQGYATAQTDLGYLSEPGTATKSLKIPTRYPREAPRYETDCTWVATGLGESREFRWPELASRLLLLKMSSCKFGDKK